MNKTESILRDKLGLRIPMRGNKNYCVQAGAGAGKTTLLSVRVCAQILQGIPIDEFAIITYTNAAAAELRESITKQLQKVADSPREEENVKSIAKKALENSELMKISTIHSFLYEILRENAFESQIELNAVMLEEDAETTRRTKFFDNWCSKPENAAEINTFRSDWTETGKTRIDRTDVIMRNLFADLAGIRESVVIDSSDHTKDYESVAKAVVDKWRIPLKALRDNITDPAIRPKNKSNKEPKKLNKIVEEYVDLIDEAGAVTETISQAVSLSEALSRLKSVVDEGKNVYNGFKDLVPGVDDVAQSIIESLPEYELEWNFSKLYEEYLKKAEAVNRIAAYANRIKEAYQDEIDRETDRISNDDILFRSEKLFMEHPEILDKTRKKYSKLYVDEFQDTTNVQTKIVRMLSEKPGTKPLSGELEEDKLLIVGDSKQSIYRFTGAEKNLFDQMSKLFTSLPGEIAESCTLATNFRSNKSIVDWVNRSFGALMGADYSPMETDWETREKNALHGVFRYVPQDAYDKMEQDVQELVKLVSRLVDNENIVIEEYERSSDGSEGTYRIRKIRYSDIMIIFRNTTDMKLYVEGLSAASVPLNIQGKMKIDDDEILRNFVLLTDYIARPKRDKATKIAIQIIQNVDITRADKKTIKEAEKKIKKIRSFIRTHYLDHAATVRYLMSHEEWFVPADVEIPKTRVRSYRVRMHQMIESCLANCTGDLKQLVDLMYEYLESEVKRENRLESNENAVRIMNIHQAKGLTGRIVIIAKRNNEEKCYYSGFKREGSYYPSASYKKSKFGGTVNLPSYGYSPAELRNEWCEETAESIRLQYVAATRAAHALILMPTFEGKKNKVNNQWFTNREYTIGALDCINDWMDEQETKNLRLGTESGAFAGETGAVRKLTDFAEELKSAKKEKLEEKRIKKILPSSLELAGVTGYPSNHEDYVKEDRPASDTFGTVLHRMLEFRCSRDRQFSVADSEKKSALVERIAKEAILENRDDLRGEESAEAYLEFLKDAMNGRLGDKIDEILENAEEVFPEYTFSMVLEGSERDDFLSQFDSYLKGVKIEPENISEKLHLTGSMDLMVKGKDGRITIYDFKSDSRNGKPLQEFEDSQTKKYAGQLALYKYVAQKLTGETEIATELVHLY